MPLQIIRNDITTMKVDAIVNAANSTLLGGGGVDGAIHRAAGPMLLEECRTLNGCRTGEAKITKGYNLPARYVIHTVGPIWNTGDANEHQLLANCYRNSLKLAKDNALESIAFPLISAGVYGCPIEISFKTALDVANEFLIDNDMEIYIVVFGGVALHKASRFASSIKEYIDDNYVDEHYVARNNRDIAQENLYGMAMPNMAMPSMAPEPERKAKKKGVSLPGLFKKETVEATAEECSMSLTEALEHLDESFTQSLLGIIDSRGLKDSEVYKKANIDRKLFSKIRSDINYKPKKTTALALAIALELSLDETEALIRKAGFALSSSNKLDVIVKYFIINREYNINDINVVLFSYDLPILGSY